MLNCKITKEEEQELWNELEEAGLLPREVEVLPECAVYIGKDHHGNEEWRACKEHQWGPESWQKSRMRYVIIKKS